MPSEPRYKQGDKIKYGTMERTLLDFDGSLDFAAKERAEGRAEALGEVDRLAANVSDIGEWEVIRTYGGVLIRTDDAAGNPIEHGRGDTFTESLLSTEGEKDA